MRLNKGSLLIQVPIFIAVRTGVNTLVRMVYPLLPIFGRGLEIDLRLLSLAITIRSASGVFGPFLASVGDSRGRKVGMVFGVSLFTAGAAVMSLWPSYPGFVIMLVLGIMANFVFVPSMQAFLGDRVPYERRGFVLGLGELGWSLSYIIGVPIIGAIIARYGWQAPFPWLAGFGLAAMSLLWLILPNDRPTAPIHSGVLKNLGKVIAYPPALAGILFGLALSAANEQINLTFGIWLEDAFAVKIAALAVASAIIGASELTGELLVIGFVDWIGKRRAVTIGLALNAAAALALPYLGGTLTGALVGLFLIYLTFEFTLVSSIPLMSEVIPTARATFMSVYIAAMAIGRAFGALVVPLLYRDGAASSILPVMIASVAFNGIAFVALRGVNIRAPQEPSIQDA